MKLSVKLPVIDSHIHLDQYTNEQQKRILSELNEYQIKSLISVSTDFRSSNKNLELCKQDRRIKSAFGFHPEKPLPKEKEIGDLFRLMECNQKEMIAVGEVGLPYYTKLKNSAIENEAYVKLLEEFIKKAVKWNKPVVLHAIYEDAPIAIRLLEQYSLKKAHFHWFKGDEKTLQHMAENGYYISFTPDVIYKEKTRKIAKNYPLEQMMVETDGPWPFEGPFNGEMTHPKMIHGTIQELAKIKKMDANEMYQQLYKNTVEFYCMSLEGNPSNDYY